MSIILEKLTKHELDSMTVGPSITTITFFEGSVDIAKAELTSKLHDMVSSNPWLMGTLHKKDSNLQLEQSQVITENDIQKIINPFNPEAPEPKLNSKMTQFEMCSSISNTPAEIPAGSNLIDNNKPLIALSLIKDSLLENKFAVIFSVSHVIVDGQTYYNLLSMLTENGTPSSMSSKRKDDIAQQEETLVGKEEMEVLKGGGIMCNVISSMLFGSKPLITNYLVNTERVISEKSNKDGVDFLSTNDILSSTYGNVTKARLLLLPFNMRGKVEHFKYSDAGNQESSLGLTQHDYETPSLIRKTLNTKNPKYIRATNTPLPTGCEACGCKLAMITNWTFDVFTQLDIKDCNHVAHMPHSNVSLIPFDVAVVQRPKKGKLAVTFFVRNIKDDDLVKAMPLNQKSIKNADDFKDQFAEN